jgi:periplasmic copper chaperone A
MPKKWIYVAITAAGLTVALATPATAHVITDPGEATQGGYAAFAFRVPNERTDAGTVKLEVTLPADHPIGSVYTKPLTGWTAQVVKEGDAVRRITWTAQPGVRIDPGQFQEFKVSVGPLPTDTDKLVMPAVQTYDNGQVVAWDEPPTGGAEPQRPAPLLALHPGAAGGAAHGGDGATVTDVATSAHDATDSTARWLSGAALVAAALGLGFGVGAVLRTSRRRSA